MSYNLEGSAEASGDGPDIAVMEGNAGDLAVDDPNVGETVTYPTVSVIIPTYTRERWEWLQECVASVRAQQVPPLEIIVVVDHNPALLEEIAVEFPDVIAVPNIGDQGVSGARNSGVKASRGEVAAFLDDDSIATPDWLSTLLRHLVTPGVVGVGCYSDGLWETPCPKWFPGEFSWTIGVSYSGLPKEPTAVRNVWTSAMLVWRSAFEVVDGFREDFGKIGNKSLPEDTDLCLRIASAREGAIWIWDPAKVMQHRVPAGRATFGYLMSRCFLQGWGKAAMAHMDGFAESTSAERKYAIRTLPAGFGRGLVDALRGDLSGLGRSGAIVAALTVTLGGYAWYVLEGLTGRRRRGTALRILRQAKSCPGKPGQLLLYLGAVAVAGAVRTAPAGVTASVG
jgi:Glycosyl transferase family 2